MGEQALTLFIDRMIEAIERKKNPTVVGLDPRLDLLPDEIMGASSKDQETVDRAVQGILVFNRRIIDIIEPIAPAVKLQVAFYEVFGPKGYDVYFQTIEYAKAKGLVVIGDIKRGDIGSTAEAYSKGHLEDSEICGVKTGGAAFPDAVTLNPYLGRDSVEPFLQSCRKTESGVFILVKTSNPSSADFQNLDCGGAPLYMKVAEKVDQWGQEFVGESGYSSVAAVVGATHPNEILEIRERYPRLFMLLPGYGAQGGTADMVRTAFDRKGRGAIINSSRGIIFAGAKSEKTWEAAVKDASLKMRDDLQRILE